MCIRDRSKRKFEVGRQIQFAGYLVGENGVKPDPDRIRAIKDFPQPTNLTGVRSFLGLAQQLSFFIPDFSHATAAIRQLLGKEKAFQWLPEHSQEFDQLKAMLTTSLLTRHFDPSKQVTLLTEPPVTTVWDLRYAKRSKEHRQSLPVAPNHSHQPSNGMPP